MLYVDIVIMENFEKEKNKIIVERMPFVTTSTDKSILS